MLKRTLGVLDADDEDRARSEGSEGSEGLLHLYGLKVVQLSGALVRHLQLPHLRVQTARCSRSEIVQTQVSDIQSCFRLIQTRAERLHVDLLKP
jgi:hypothetical protein